MAAGFCALMSIKTQVLVQGHGWWCTWGLSVCRLEGRASWSEV